MPRKSLAECLPHSFDLQTLVENIKVELQKLAKNDAIHAAGKSVISILHKNPDAVLSLAHTKLHAYPFREVPLCWRRAYEEACLWKIVGRLEKIVLNEPGNSNGGSNQSETFRDIIATCDMAVMLTGAPARRNLIDAILQSFDDEECNDHKEEQRPAKRQRLESPRQELLAFASSPNKAIPRLTRPVPRFDRPSMEVFGKHMHEQGTPIVLCNTIEHWPALQRWREPRYWLGCTHQGRRLVPVELGKSYTDGDWGQKIMSFRDYMMDHLIEKDDASSAAMKRKGYLAQHDLLTQIPSLRNDIAIPDYCFVDTPRPSPGNVSSTERPAVDEQTGSTPSELNSDDEVTDPLLNIWLGPEQSISPAHTDPHQNILAQVLGRKYVRLFAPSETPKMYPMSGGIVDMGNTSSVDVGAFVDFAVPASGESSTDVRRAHQMDQFPLFSDAKFVEAVLEPGDCLYIPRGWWHYVRSLEVSCSVSFWWD